MRRSSRRATPTPFATTICANALSQSTTVSVAAYNSSGAFLGQVIDANANGVALCMNFANTVGHVHEYGNIVEIDHDNGLTSRYAHLSRSLVKAGDVVLKGQPVAHVGSTGRTTGPHLHFEVREKGIPLNPNKFLSLGTHADSVVKASVTK